MASEQLVLIVDSDPREQRVLAVSLRKAGLGVRAVSDARSALRALDEDDGSIGVMIVELNIDGIDGFELCERVRESSRFDGLALIAVTGSRDLATKLRAFETGYDELVTKPIYVKELATRVELMLERKARDLLALAEAPEVDGSLRSVPLVDLLQAIGEHGRTGFLRLESDDAIGEVHFADGGVVDAETGGHRGESALYRMIRWRDGYYAIKYLKSSRRRRRISRTVEDVVAEGLERLDRFSQLEARLPMDRVFEVDYDRLGRDLEGMPAAVRGCLRLFDGFRTLEDVVLLAPVGDLEALRLAARLHERGQLVEVAASEVGGHASQNENERSSAISAWLGDESSSDPTTLETADVEPVPSWQRVSATEASAPRSPSSEHVEETRRRLERARAALEDEQSRVLANIARTEAAAAREQDARARAEIEQRTEQRTRADDLFESREASSPQPSSVRDQVMASLAEVDDLFAFGDEEDEEGLSVPGVRFQSSPMRDEAEADDHEILPARSAESTPEHPVDASEVAWEARVQEHVRLYRVETSSHVLRPQTIIDDEVEPVERASQAIYDRARLLVSDVYDSVERPLGPGGDESIPEVDVDSGSDPSGFRRGRRPVEVVRPSQVGPAAQRTTQPAIPPAKARAQAAREEASSDPSAPDDRAAAGTAAAPHVSRTAGAAPGSVAGNTDRGWSPATRNDVDPIGDTPLQHDLPSRVSEPDAGRDAGAARAVSADRAVEQAADRGREADAASAIDTESADRVATRPDAAESSPESTSSAEDTPRERPERVAAESLSAPESEPAPAKPGDSFDEAFFHSGDIDPPAEGQTSRFGTIVALLVIVILVGAFVVLLRQGDDGDAGSEDSSSEDAVSAQPTAPETTNGQDTPDVVEAESPDPFESDEGVDDPATDPFYLAAVTEGEVTAEYVSERAPAVADAMASGPAETTEPEPEPEPVVEAAAPKPDPKPERRPDPKPERRPDPKPDPKPDSKPEPEKTVEKKPSGGALAKGKKAFKKGKFKDAIEHLEEAVAAAPGDVEANYYLGRAYVKTRNWSKAVKHLEKARGARGGSATFWKDLGTAYIAVDKKKLGRDAYQKALELDPDGKDSAKLERYLEQFD